MMISGQNTEYQNLHYVTEWGLSDDQNEIKFNLIFEKLNDDVSFCQFLLNCS